MRKILVVIAVAFSLSCLYAAPAAQAGEMTNIHRFGLGVNYWKTLHQLDIKDVHEDGFSYLASYQYAPVRYFKVEADLELYPYLGTGRGAMWSPEVFVTAGELVYVGVGTGIYYSEGDWGSAPFYMLRAGLDFPVMPHLFIDVNVNYRFNDWNTLRWNDLSTETIRLGAAIRYTL